MDEAVHTVVMVNTAKQHCMTTRVESLWSSTAAVVSVPLLTSSHPVHDLQRTQPCQRYKHARSLKKSTSSKVDDIMMLGKLDIENVPYFIFSIHASLHKNVF